MAQGPGRGSTASAGAVDGEQRDGDTEDSGGSFSSSFFLNNKKLVDGCVPVQSAKRKQICILNIFC